MRRYDALAHTTHRARDCDAAAPDRPFQKGRGAGLVALAFLAASLTGLVSCIGWQVRPESAVIVAPPDEVWNATLELLREREFKIEQQDNNTHTLQATKEIVTRMVSDRATPTTAQKIRHQANLSLKERSDGRSVLEVIYRIDKVVVEDEAFRFLQAVRDRVAISQGGATTSPQYR